MMQFDGYRWEDRVPKPGRWKLDLVLGALALAVLTMTLRPDLSARETDVRSPNKYAVQFIRPAMSDASDPGRARDKHPSSVTTRMPCASITS